MCNFIYRCPKFFYFSSELFIIAPYVLSVGKRWLSTNASKHHDISKNLIYTCIIKHRTNFMVSIFKHIRHSDKKLIGLLSKIVSCYFNFFCAFKPFSKVHSKSVIE